MKSKRHGINCLKKELRGSYTVEAVLIMAVTLFLLASLLTEAFKIHSQVVSNMVLQDAMEQAGHMEEGMSTEEILKHSNRRLKAYFRCGDKAVSVEERGRSYDGTALGGRELYRKDISVKKFDPEHFLRLLRAIGV